MDAVLGHVERLLERIEVRLNRLLAKEWRRRVAYGLVLVTGVLGFATGAWWLLMTAFAITVALIVVALDDA